MDEPELAVLAIAEGRPLDEIPALCLWRAGEPVLTGGERERIELSSMPLPAFDLLPMERYNYVLMGPRTVLLEGSRGCPHKCTSCLQAMYGPVYRKKSGAQLIREVRHAVEEHGARNIVFIDMEFCLNRAAVEELCDFLAGPRYDMRWCCNTRGDAVDLQLLRRMKAAGCRLVNYGVESGDQAMVDHINKRLDLGRVQEAVRMTQEAGMEALAFFMLGLPGETREQMRQTSRFARELAPDYASFHIFTPYPCTAAFQELGAPGTPLFPSTSGQYAEPELRRVVQRAMLAFHLRPGFALRYARNLWKRGDLLHTMSSQARLFLSYLRG
jgi:radical SAM superfamily enzyme YgiQ (UPF0313 family)